jgi:carboxyl-terminal processing protease
VTIVRFVVSLLLLLAIGFPTHSAQAATCEPGTAASESLSLVEEAYEVLSLLFVERPAAPDLLVPAVDAAQTSLGADDEGSMGDNVSDMTSFSDVYCAMWTGKESSYTYDAVSYPSIAAMTVALNEGHTHFLTPEMYSDHKAWQSGDVKYEGIGARLTGDPLTIQHVFPGSPADQAGVQFGDQILAIDGEPAADMPVNDAVMLIRGEGGTTVNLSIQRPGAAAALNLDIARGTIAIPTLEARMIGDIAYLHIDSFPTSELPHEVLAELQNFRSEGAKGLILDLRDNSGGRLDVGSEIAGYFLPENTPLYQQTTRRGQQKTTTSGGSPIWTAPMVVLINDGTASMGEILASALQEGKVATLLGTTTAGEVAGSIVVPLSDGSALQVTTLRIDSGEGTVLNNIGVHPDIELAASVDDVRNGVDGQMQEALSRLRTQLGESAPPSSNTTLAPAR